MPHIHIQPDQHDMTVSAWIVRKDEGGWKCLVHYHRKMDMLMQIGGHIELNETPWQSMVSELVDESGYHPDDLQVVQFTSDIALSATSVIHPVPFVVNTHSVGNGHFHSDFTYGFVADDVPHHAVAEGESSDLRWLTIAELQALAKVGETPNDLVALYQYLIKHIDDFVLVPANSFSLEKPTEVQATYKRGAPGEQVV